VDTNIEGSTKTIHFMDRGNKLAIRVCSWGLAENPFRRFFE
jgi:hypothetical protein